MKLLKLLLIAAALAVITPSATADANVDAGAARVAVETSAHEDCVPAAAACVIEWRNRTAPAGDWEWNADWTLGARATVRAVPNGTPWPEEGVHVASDDASVRLPAVAAAVSAWDRVHPLLPDQTVLILDVRGDRAACDVRWIYVSSYTGEREPAPEYLDCGVPWERYANESHVRVDRVVAPKGQTDGLAPGNSGYDFCQDVNVRDSADPSRCATARPQNLTHHTWDRHTPNVIWGASYNTTGADVEPPTAAADEGSPVLRAGSTAARAAATPALPRGHSAIPLPDHGRLHAPAGEVERAGAVASRAETASARVQGAAHAGEASPLGARAREMAAGAVATTALALAVWSLYFRGRVRGEGPAALLRCPTRRKILEVVRANPGLTAADLVRRVGAKHNTVLYHVRLLDKGKLLTIVRNEGPRSFLRIHPAKGVPRGPARDASLVLNSPAARAVAARLLENPRHGLTVGALATLTGLSASGIRYHLAALERRHLVVTDQSVGRVAFRIVEDARDGVGLALALTAGEAPSAADSAPAAPAAADGSPA